MKIQGHIKHRLQIKILVIRIDGERNVYVCQPLVCLCVSGSDNIDTVYFQNILLLH